MLFQDRFQELKFQWLTIGFLGGQNDCLNRTVNILHLSTVTWTVCDISLWLSNVNLHNINLSYTSAKEHRNNSLVIEGCSVPKLDITGGNVYVKNSRFQDNELTAVTIQKTHLTIEHCIFRNIRYGSGTAGLLVFESNVEIQNCTFVENQASHGIIRLALY